MKRYLFLIVLLVTAGSVRAQRFAFEYWHDGRIVLESGDTLRGQVKYNMQDDIVQAQVHGALETFTARKAVFYEIYDASVKRYRQFYSLPFAAAPGQYRAQVFFELLQEGKMTLLSREVLETRTYSSYYAYPGYTRVVLVDKYFLLKENGTIQQFSGKKSDFLDLLGDKSDRVQKYIKENKLDFDNKYDVARAVEYFNKL